MAGTSRALLLLLATLPFAAAVRPYSWFSQLKALVQPSLVAETSELDGYTVGAHDDFITGLPGMKHEFQSRHFSGYLEIDAEKGRNIFYYFVESEKDPANAPVLFWTNGGPGCSGLIGLLTEHGPFRVTRDGDELKKNPYTWAKEANVFYVEQPAGVGFSYSEDESFYTDGLGDEVAAADNYRIVLKFFEKFPQYKANDFYLSSESYGGHYMPTLAKKLVDEQAKVPEAEKLNFLGFLVGNPYNNPDENMLGTVSALWGRQLVPKPVHDEWFKTCMVDAHVCPLWDTTCEAGKRHQLPEEYDQCEQLVGKMRADIGDLDVYGLEWPVCHNEELAGGRAQRVALMAAVEEGRAAERLRHGLKPKDSSKTSREPFVPCEEGWSDMYLNREDVHTALHVRHVPARDPKWRQCTNRHGEVNPTGHIVYNMTDMKNDMSPYYKYLIESGLKLKILIFSGDADSVCAPAGTQAWMYDFKYPVKQSWEPWKVDDQVAGYVTKFDGFSFVTVRDSGHEVPTYQPKRALEVLRRFLAKEDNEFF
mmetsp:Transcript_31372/g.68588  ORF Transcript_31372/g.68588 Transcript_31372/m.68588 type:complete len:535 (-) Transcript_31372:466-2070(-)